MKALQDVSWMRDGHVTYVLVDEDRYPVPESEDIRDSIKGVLGDADVLSPETYVGKIQAFHEINVEREIGMFEEHGECFFMKKQCDIHGWVSAIMIVDSDGIFIFPDEATASNWVYPKNPIASDAILKWRDAKMR